MKSLQKLTKCALMLSLFDIKFIGTSLVFKNVKKGGHAVDDVTEWRNSLRGKHLCSYLHYYHCNDYVDKEKMLTEK